MPGSTPPSQPALTISGLNAVVLKGRNEDEALDLVDFAQQREIDIAFIEEMPLGLIDEHDRALMFLQQRRTAARYRLNNTSLLPLGDPRRRAPAPHATTAPAVGPAAA